MSANNVKVLRSERVEGTDANGRSSEITDVFGSGFGGPVDTILKALSKPQRVTAILKNASKRRLSVVVYDKLKNACIPDAALPISANAA
jgi:hypothetical protein